ncbi:MAG TPA: hypothetical protein VJQ56_12575 [Blastocatellia bacterium]|nr:hypothetical protein [Blastocatellia bacterium]
MRFIRSSLSAFISITLILTLGGASLAQTARRAPFLGADTVWADGPHQLIYGWQERPLGVLMTQAFKDAGLRSLRLNFGGLYSPLGPEATARVKAENKWKNEFPWFPIDIFVDYIAEHDFTTVVGVNVEEGPDVASDVIDKFLARGLASKLVAVELSNEPWLNHRPWLPEEYAARAADVIERLTPRGVKFGLPLTVGKERNTPTKLSDNEWNTRMMRALGSRIDLRNRSDIYGVIHLYARGVQAKTIKQFNALVKPFAPNMRYLVTEFNIRLSLKGNPHLTNEYAMEFARKLAELMAQPEIDGLYVHAVPYHSVMYWASGKRVATISGHYDPKLPREAYTRGWHITPTGKVYKLYSDLAWNGEIITYQGGKQSYWAVKADDGRLVVTLLNDSGSGAKKRVVAAGREMNLSAPPRSIVCFDESGRVIEQLSLTY